MDWPTATAAGENRPALSGARAGLSLSRGSAKDRGADCRRKHDGGEKADRQRDLQSLPATFEALRFEAAPALFNEMLFPPVHGGGGWNEFSMEAR